MKSAFAATVAATALIASTEAQTLWSTRNTKDVVDADCKSGAYFGTNAYGSNLVFLPPGSTCDLASNTKYTQITQPANIADLCFTQKTGGYSYNAGGNVGVCPTAFGAACTSGSKCPIWLNKEGVDCPSDNKCHWPTPTALLVSRATFSGPYGNFQPPPSEINRAIGTAVATKCPVYQLDKVFELPDKDPKTISQGWAIKNPANCDPAAVQELVQVAVDTYKASEAAKNAPYPTVSGTFSISTTAGDISCYNTLTNTWSCVGKEELDGCTMKCPNNFECQSATECAGGFCKPSAQDPNTNVCQSNAVVAMVAPVLAAALAIAFF